MKPLKCLFGWHDFEIVYRIVGTQVKCSGCSKVIVKVHNPLDKERKSLP